MPYQEIKAELSDPDVQAIKTDIATIEKKLPFLISLTDSERKQLFKIGPERFSFVQLAAQAAVNNPNIIPASFGEDGFQSAVTLISSMTDIATVSSQLLSKIDDTRVAVGVEAMSQASDVYNYVKAAAKETPGLKPLADQLGQLYQKAVATRRAHQIAKVAAMAAK